MLLSGLALVGFGLLMLLLSHFSKDKMPEEVRRSRGFVLDVSQAAHQQHIKVQYFAGRESITFSGISPSDSPFFPGQQVFVDYAADMPDKPLQLLSIQEVWGRKFLLLIISVLLIVAGMLLVRAGA